MTVLQECHVLQKPLGHINVNSVLYERLNAYFTFCFKSYPCSEPTVMSSPAHKKNIYKTIIFFGFLPAMHVLINTVGFSSFTFDHLILDRWVNLPILSAATGSCDFSC